MAKAVYQRTDSFDAEAIAGMAAHYRALMEAVGEDPDRGALADTPVRAAKALAFLTNGMHQDPKAILESAVFEEAYNETVLVKDIELFSLCEHHLLPFFGKAHVAYVPNGRIVGLSKIPRVVDAFARRLQVQERLTVQIRDAVDAALRPQGVAVIIQAQHLCMQMRGVEKQHSMTTTSAYTGVFREDLKAREAFIKLAIG